MTPQWTGHTYLTLGILAFAEIGGEFNKHLLMNMGAPPVSALFPEVIFIRYYLTFCWSLSNKLFKREKEIYGKLLDCADLEC